MSVLKMILYAESFYNLGIDFQELGLQERAIENYRRALEIKPDYAEALINLGNILRDLGQLEEAVTHYLCALKIKPDFAMVHYNLGNTLQELGRFEEAIASYHLSLEINPNFTETHTNLGNALRNIGQLEDAIASYYQALALKSDYAVTHCNSRGLVTPHLHESITHMNLGLALLDVGDISAAEKHLNTALSIDSNLAQAHQGMACIFQRLGNEDKSRYHRDIGFGKNPLSSIAYRGRGKPKQLLVMGSALEGNMPWQFLIDPNIFQTTLIAVEYFDSQLPLPPHHLILNAIGDADICETGLKIVSRLIEKSPSPVINDPEAVLLTGRLTNAIRLGKLSGVITPRMALVSKVDLSSDQALEIIAKKKLTFPLLLRPPGFHRGNYFVCADNHDTLKTAIKDLPGESLLAMEFLDSRSEDNLIRKYRVISINGSLYPIHMAISTQWKVHYFSSGMDKHEEYRKEEEEFLNNFRSFLSPSVILSLEKINQTLGLDYCGIDFGLDKNRNILLYEANSTMLINQLTEETRWDYRRIAINNAMSATKRLLIERISLPE